MFVSSQFGFIFSGKNELLESTTYLNPIAHASDVNDTKLIMKEFPTSLPEA
uniref:Uncharacterized protein n=1 Tax=Onchocerca volvulus TaxID=6282 RepID=A0A8R1TP03_ONCVO